MTMATRIPRLGNRLRWNSIQSRLANTRCGFSSLQNTHHRGATPVPSISSASRNNPSYYERNRPQMRGMSIPARAIHKLPGATTRDMAELEDRVWSTVGATVQDPEIDVDLKTLGWMNRRLAISKDTTVQILLTLPTLLHPSLDELKNLVKSAAEHEIRQWSSEKGLDAEIKVNVEAIASKPVPWMAKDAEDQKDIESRLGPGLANVAHILAVYSCKGGVGKSTVAVNLAYELARMGGRVGLLDVDVYGPSLPVLVKVDDPEIRQSPLGENMVYPIDHKGVKLLSLGFVSPKSGVQGSGQNAGATVLRGPMASKVVTQLLKGTDWGGLDVLVLDLPPGTGDVQLTLCQDLDMSGAIGVTTPSKLAIADARKGIEMFSTLGIQTIAMVENMAYFECEGGGRHFPFGKGFKEFLEDDDTMAGMKTENVCQLPISSIANEANDTGVPLTLARPDAASNELNAFGELAHAVSKELFRMPYRSIQVQEGQVFFEDDGGTFEISALQLSQDKDDSFLVRAFSESGALQKRIPPEELRSRDPRTGQKLETVNNEHENDDDEVGMVKVHRSKSSKGHKKVVPKSVEKKAKVGYEVTWGDGAKYIYSRRAIALAAGGVLES